MTWELFLSIIAIIFSIFAVYLGYLFNKKIENYRLEQIQRQKAELVAKLIAKWIKYRGNEKELLRPKERVEYYEELTQLSFELSLWLKDELLLKEIMKCLQNDPGSKKFWDLIVMTRDYILDTKSNLDSGEHVTFWPSGKDAEALFKKSTWK